MSDGATSDGRADDDRTARSPWSLHVGTVRGVDIDLHVSVVVTLVLVLASLAEVSLPGLVEDRSRTAYWVAAAVGTIAFFAGLLLHELAHAVVAQGEGVEISTIQLWMLGGAAGLSGEPATPRAEARIAAAGPLLPRRDDRGGVVLGLAELGGDVLTVAVHPHRHGGRLVADFIGAHISHASTVAGGRVAAQGPTSHPRRRGGAGTVVLGDSRSRAVAPARARDEAATLMLHRPLDEPTRPHPLGTRRPP